MPVLDQHRDNPAFVQSLTRKRSKRRIIAPGNSIQKPAAEVARKPSLDLTPKAITAPDAGVSEVTTSLATLFSQSSLTPLQAAEDLASQQRAPAADMTTALSQQRRLDVAEVEPRPKSPDTVHSTNIQQRGPFYDDVSSGDESTDDDTLGRQSSRTVESSATQSGSIGAAPGGVSQDTGMVDEDVEQSLFIRANSSRASQQPQEIQAPTPAETPAGLTQWYADDVERVNARRDEQDPDFCPDPEVTSQPEVVSSAQKVVDRPGRMQQQPSPPPRKRHSSEIRRETPKKPKGGQIDEDGKHPTTIKGKRFVLLKEDTRKQRCDLINHCESKWRKSMAEVIGRSLWPRSRDKNQTPLEPRDWPTTLLEQMSQLADFTARRPDIAALAIQQAINERRSWYDTQPWLLFVDDAKAAVQLAMSGTVVIPVEKDTRVDSPLLEVVRIPQESEPTTGDPDTAMSLEQDTSEDELGNASCQDDLYGCTPRPQPRPTEILSPIQPSTATAFADIVDLTMDDASDQDVKRPAAWYNGQPASNRGSGRPISLEMIMNIQAPEDLSSFTFADMLKIYAAAREWHIKANQELSSEGRKLDDFANQSLGYVFRIFDHTDDVQGWIREERVRRGSGS